MQRAILSVTLALAGGQATSQSYAGTWTAELAGQTYVRLELQVTNGALGGRISLGNIEVDSGGEVKTALAAPNEFTPLFDVVLKDSVLSFSRKDGNDTDSFELRLVDSRAELRFIPSDADRAELATMGTRCKANSNEADGTLSRRRASASANSEVRGRATRHYSCPAISPVRARPM